MVIFKGEHLNYEWTKGEIPNTISNTESSGISPLDVQAPTQSLSVSLSQTRSLLSELSEFLNQPKAPVKAKNQLLEFSLAQNPFHY